MRRHRALALAVVLVVVCLVPIAPRSLGAFVPVSALAQEAAEPEPGSPTDLAIIALHCAEAPAADALTSYFATGAPPDACAPAVGVAITVSEGDAALPDSPFRTDVAGSLLVPVGLGSQVEVAEDPESLPDGYEPVIGEANGVPYANPVRLDAAVAGAAVLFVNVPAPVAALAQEAGETTDLEDAASPADYAVADGNGCDLAAPAAREATALAPLAEPRALGTTIYMAGSGHDPMSSDGAPAEVAASGNSDAVVSNPTRAGAGIWGWQDRNRSDNQLWRFDGSRAGDWRVHGKSLWLWPGNHANNSARSLVVSGSSARIGDGVWFLNWDSDQVGRWFWGSRFGTDHLAAARSGDGNLALVSNSVHIGDGVWRWPSDGRADDWRDDENTSWTWGDDRDRDHDHDWRMDDRAVCIRSGAFASSGNGSVAVSAHRVHIEPGVWFWPHDRHRADDWRWRGQDRFDDWFVHGNGFWLWPGRIGIDNLAAARSGNGSLAIVASAVRIDHGVWQLPPGRAGHGLGLWAGSEAGDDWLRPRHIGSGIWVLSTAVARSSSGTLAVSSHAVRIDTGVWLLPTDRDRGHDWLGQGRHGHGNEAAIESHVDDGNIAVASPPGKVESNSSTEPPAQTSGDGLAVEALPADAIEPPSDDMGQPAVEAAQPIDNGNAVASSDEPVAAPLDVAASSSDADAGDFAPAPAVSAVEAAPAAGAPDAGSVAPDPGYTEPAAVEQPAIAPADEAPVAAPSAEPVYVEPAPDYVEPALENAGNGGSEYLDPAFADPVVDVDAGYVEPAVTPGDAMPAIYSGFNDPGVGGRAGFALDPGIDAGIAAPDAGAPGLGFADPGGDPGFAAPESVAVAPSGGGSEIGVPGSAAPDISLDAPGNVAPDADLGLSGGDGEDE